MKEKYNKKELNKQIQKAEEAKKKVIDNFKKLSLNLALKKITQEEFNLSLDKIFLGKTPHEWINYYNEEIRKNKNILGQEITDSQTKKLKVISISFIFILFLTSIFLVSNFFFPGDISSGITGRTVQEIAADQNVSLNESEIFTDEQINETVESESSDNSQFQIEEQDEQIIEQKTVKEEIVKEEKAIEDKISSKEIEVITLQSKPIINQQTHWLKIIKANNIEEIKEMKIYLPKDAINIEIKTGKDISNAVDEIKELNGNIENSESNSLIAVGITGAVIGAERENFLFRLLKSVFEFFKRPTITGNVIQEAGVQKNSQEIIIDIGNIAVQEEEIEIAVEYYTEGPKATEEIISRGKRLIVSGNEEINYTDILAYTSIEEKFNLGEENRIKVYWQEEKNFVSFNVKDTNNNGKIDYIEWTVPHLSDQTYDIIFITKAEHLDEQREFISDIYDQVKELDEVWSEEIKDNEYVRVTFEIPLTNTRDITLFPRIVSGNPKIEVYEINGSELIAEFISLNSEEYNKIFLDGSSGIGLEDRSQDSFDLKVIGGTIEFDHILDPIIQVDTQPSTDVSVAALNNRTFVVAWVDNAQKNITFAVYDTNGTKKVGDFGALSDVVVTGSRVSVGAINETAFAIVHYTANATIQDTTYAVFHDNGTTITGPTDLDAAVGTVGDPGRPIVMSNSTGKFIEFCFSDQAEADADVKIVAINSWGVGVESPATGADGTITQGATGQNLIQCSALNNTMFIYAFFDDADNDATFVRMTTTGSANAIATTTDIDNEVGETGQVAVTTINKTYFAFAWYDSNHTKINMTVHYGNISQIGPAITVDNNASGGGSNDSRLAMATVKELNHSENENWFIVAWNDRNAYNINASVFNATGSIKYNYILAVDENVSSPLFDIYGREDLNDFKICDGSFLFAYTNDTGSVVVKTLYVNGTSWDGVCNRDQEYPTFSLFNEVPANGTSYVQGSRYNINSTVNSTNGTVGIEFNNVNYTAFNYTTKIFNVSFIDLGAGTYGYYWFGWGNGSRHYYNTSSLRYYTITKSLSEVNLSFNSTEGNATMLAGTSILLNGTRITGDSTARLYLYINGTLINNNTQEVSNFTPFNFVGLHNITVVYEQSQNYSESFETYWINVTTVSSAPPQIVFVTPISNVDPVEDGIREIHFNFTIQDNNGFGDINFSSIKSVFNLSGEALRSNNSCTLLNTYSAIYANFTCNMTMRYFDGSGIWGINISVSDNSSNYADNLTTTFTYNELTAMVLYPTALTWGSISVSATNSLSNNDPIRLNNTGNDNSTGLLIQVNASDLHGETDNSKALYAQNFSVSETDSCDIGPTMQNKTYITITNAFLPKGDHSPNNGTNGQEEIYFCLESINSDVSPQAYSSTQEGAWIIRVLFAVFAIKRRSKKKFEKDNLVKALLLILDELKTKYSLSKTETMNLIIKELKAKYKLNKEEISELIGVGREESIPAGIFVKEIGGLEAVCKYLKENLGMSFREISKELNRNERTIWTAYKKACEKMKDSIIVKESEITLPIKLFNNRKLTVLEVVILHLREKGMKHSSIAKLIERDPRNVQTIYSRAMKKLKRNI